MEDVERESGRWWDTDLKASSQKMLLPHFPSGSSGNVMWQFYILYKIQSTFFFFLMEILSFFATWITISSVYHLETVTLTFRAPHSSTVSASSTTVIRKFGVCRSSLKRRPFSKILQPIERVKGELKKWIIYLYDIQPFLCKPKCVKDQVLNHNSMNSLYIVHILIIVFKKNS